MSGWRGTFRDRILGDGRIVMPPWLTDRDVAAVYMEPIVDDLRRAEVFVCDNVAEYLYAGTDQEHWGPGDFPCVAPPFPLFFVEWGRPSRVVSEVHGEVDVLVSAPAHVGWLMTAAERPDGEPGWTLGGTMFMEVDRRDPLYANHPDAEGIWWSSLLLVATLAGDGSIERLEEPWIVYTPPNSAERLGFVAETFGSLLWPAFLSLTFLNCRNVDREPVEVPAGISKRDRKRGREPHKGYHVLDIGPMQRTLRHEGGADTHGIQRALHVCRGHFKTYTEDAPLFGRVTGTWWWAPQLRGSREAGEVHKDYRLKGGPE